MLELLNKLRRMFGLTGWKCEVAEIALTLIILCILLCIFVVVMERLFPHKPTTILQRFVYPRMLTVSSSLPDAPEDIVVMEYTLHVRERPPCEESREDQTG